MRMCKEVIVYSKRNRRKHCFESSKYYEITVMLAGDSGTRKVTREGKAREYANVAHQVPLQANPPQQNTKSGSYWLLGTALAVV
jgi:hypothetical protein